MANPNQTDPAQDGDETYEPSTVQANLAREQGSGVGQKDIDYQRDPTGARSADQYSLSSDSQIAKDRGREEKRRDS